MTQTITMMTGVAAMTKSKNDFELLGTVAFEPKLSATKNGKNILPLRLECGQNSIPTVSFSPLSEALAQILHTGDSVGVSGFINARQDPESKYTYPCLVIQRFCLNGKDWLGAGDVEQKPQQVVSQHANSSCSQGQLPLDQPHMQPQAQPQMQPQQQSHQPSAETNQPVQTREEFLSTNQYRKQSATGQQSQGGMANLLNNKAQDGTVSQEAVAAQAVLYGKSGQADKGSQDLSQPITTTQQAEASLQQYQNGALQASTQDDSEIIDFSGGAA